MNLVNQGRTAEIFDLGNNKILKLFRKSTNLTAIEEEMTMANIIQDYNLPIPKFFGKMEYDERIGLIYEYITGQTLSFCLLRKPWALFSFAKQMAEIHSMIHKVKLEEIPGPNYQQKYRLEWIINHTDKLTVEAKKITIDFLNQLSEGHSLCHGDMNPNNILLSEQGPVVIDWMSATAGNPAGDVARIIIVLKYSALPSDLPFLFKNNSQNAFIIILCVIYQTLHQNHRDKQGCNKTMGAANCCRKFV